MSEYESENFLLGSVDSYQARTYQKKLIYRSGTVQESHLTSPIRTRV